VFITDDRDDRYGTMYERGERSFKGVFEFDTATGV
jgi:hypothetical protein